MRKKQQLKAMHYINKYTSQSSSDSLHLQHESLVECIPYHGKRQS